MTTANPDKIRLWKAIDDYRMAGGREEHWARRDHLDAEINKLLDERGALRTAVQNLHKAKGRYHNQLAVCCLYDLVGLPNVRPVKDVK